MRLLVSTGRKPTGRISEPLRGVLVEVDPDRGRVIREASIEIPPAHTAGPGSHQELTSASLEPSGLLLQATHTEVLWIDPRTLAVVRRASDRCFHAVHSATPRPGGGAWLTSASTDSVLAIDAEGRVVERYTLGGEVPGAPLDLRTLGHDALKPHAVHPNHALQLGSALWVTCFETRECRCLLSDRRIPLPEAMPHDGRHRGGLLWFTQVTGRVVAVDPLTLERVLELDLAAMSDDPRMLGWCRGIEVVGSRLFVGFTMLRGTRHREVLRMMLRGIRGEKLPTRVVEIDLDGPRVTRQIQVGNAAGGTIYGITAVP